MKKPSGRWRIVEMEMWDQEAIDLVGPGFIEFPKIGTGRFGFVAVKGWMDCRWSERDGLPFVDFTWEGSDEGDQISGSGWAALAENGTLTGRLFIHMGDESGFTATPSTKGKKHNEA